MRILVFDLINSSFPLPILLFTSIQLAQVRDIPWLIVYLAILAFFCFDVIYLLFYLQLHVSL